MGAERQRRRIPLPSLADFVTAIGIAGTLTLIAGIGLEAGVFQGFRLAASDALYPSQGLDERVVVVGVDRQSIAEVGRPWPWPRALQATLVDQLHAAGARIVVLDLVYHPATLEDGALAGALERAGRVVVASAPELRRQRGERLFTAVAGTDPVDAIGNAAAGVGHTAITADPGDGVVRALPLAVFDRRGAVVPSLSLAAVSTLEGVDGPATIRPKGIQIGRRFVPTGRLGLLNVNYTEGLLRAGTGDAYLSAGDVLEGRVASSKLQGKVVLVGLVDPTLGDHHLTPPVKAGGMPGVFVQANAVNTMLSRIYLSPVSQTETLLWSFALAALVGLGARTARWWLSGLLALLAVGGYMAMAFVRFDRGLVMDLVYPLLVVVVAAVVTLGVRYVLEARERRSLAGLLTQYVPASVAQHLVERRRTTDMPAGTITFLFTDVVGSTAAWEQHPREMAEAMRVHDRLIEAAVQDHGGALVRPRGEGDSRFAVFIHPGDAAAAALAFNEAFMVERWPTPAPVRVRTAIHTGEAELREGDYYGSPVNRCARIRSLAGPGEIYVSEASAALVADDPPTGATLEDLGLKELKDMAEPERIFELRVEDVVGRTWEH